MNVNKKLGRFRQWAGEKMGGEVRTDTSDNFKALEMEMQLRHDGMDKLQKSMTSYVKSMSKRSEGDDKEKLLPIAHLGSCMISHGGDFDADSDFGQCLSAMGRANERIGRIQESYVVGASTTWLESVDRSMVQMREYQSTRKRLEQRRLAYDTSLAKMQKAKREDFRVEEELRSQKAKYEECSEEVYHRMQGIKDMEPESVNDLTAFLEAQLSYHERCREVLLQLKQDWPGPSVGHGGYDNRQHRSRSNTAHSYADRLNPVEEPPPPKLTIQSSHSSRSHTPHPYENEPLATRPSPTRASTFDVTGRFRREESPMGLQRLQRMPTEPSVLSNRPQLRSVQRDTYGDYDTGSPARSVRDRSVSPATSHGSAASRSTGWAFQEANSVAASGMKKAPPPPPPPSRSKKPPPPPPPMKRSALSTSEIY
jgi:hypothetical protein